MSEDWVDGIITTSLGVAIEIAPNAASAFLIAFGVGLDLGRFASPETSKAVANRLYYAVTGRDDDNDSSARESGRVADAIRALHEGE